MDQAPIVVPRGFKGFQTAIIWTRIGVGIGLLGGLDKTARRNNRNEVKGKELVGFGIEMRDSGICRL